MEVSDTLSTGKYRADTRVKQTNEKKSLSPVSTFSQLYQVTNCTQYFFKGYFSILFPFTLSSPKWFFSGAFEFKT
jgi:hypothetical protein